MLGTEELYKYVDKLGLELPAKLKSRLGTRSRRPWSDYVTNETQHLAAPDAVDFLDGLLRYDPEVVAFTVRKPLRNGSLLQNLCGTETSLGILMDRNLVLNPLCIHSLT